MTPKVIWFPAGIDACALVRLFFPHLRMPGSEFIFNFHGLNLERVRGCQVAVVQRLCSSDNLLALQNLKSLGIKVVYDLDDDMWSVPAYNPAYWGFKKMLQGFAICAREASVITVSTEHLKVMVQKQLGRDCPRVEVIENAMDYDWFCEIQDQYRKKRDGEVVVGWAGSRTHDEDVKEVFPIIPELLTEIPEMRFELVGMELPEGWKRVADRVLVRGGVPVAEWPANWKSWQWDISLAPLAKNNFNYIKSALKMLEASALRIPCVASKVAAYKRFCEGNKLLKETVLAQSRQDWKAKIKNLIADTKLRKDVGQEMWRVGTQNHSILNRMEKWDELLRSIL